jgi:hypothetical protein
VDDYSQGKGPEDRLRVGGGKRYHRQPFSFRTSLFEAARIEIKSDESGGNYCY